MRERYPAEPEDPEPLAVLSESEALEVREQIGGVLLRSPRFGEVWVALEPTMAPQLAAEEAGRGEPRPVLLAEDLVKLRGKSDETIRAALATIAVFPSARLVQ
jgi:hypothetical protein